VQRWIASLTLVAYLIGGWALPTIHHHGVGATSAFNGGVGCHAHPHVEAETAAHSTHPASCSHSCQSDDPADSQEPAAQASSGVAFRSASVDDCHGLCALCVARSLCSQRVVEAKVATGIALAGRAFLAEPSFVLQQARGNVSSRGPPQFV
jgi:hypothetical protein